jgi:GH35 family endo-1,4-beta-xylanase
MCRWLERHWHTAIDLAETNRLQMHEHTIVWRLPENLPDELPND